MVGQPAGFNQAKGLTEGQAVFEGQLIESFAKDNSVTAHALIEGPLALGRLKIEAIEGLPEAVLFANQTQRPGAVGHVDNLIFTVIGEECLFSILAARAEAAIAGQE